MSEKHLATCICNDCLPGGKREHRVRPWPAQLGKCEHPEEQPNIRGGNPRLRVPLIGGDVLEICRLCGALVGVEEPK